MDPWFTCYVAHIQILCSKKHTRHEPHEGALDDASPHAPLCSAVLLLCCA